MSVNYIHIGWHHEDNHDKVWGVIKLDSGCHDNWERGDYVTFWGRRGKKLQTKVSTDYEHDVETLVRGKERKGYKSINKDNLFWARIKSPIIAWAYSEPEIYPPQRNM